MTTSISQKTTSLWSQFKGSQSLIVIVTIFSLCCFSFSTSLAQEAEITPGILRIKLDDKISQHLDKATITNDGGVAQTGISRLDQLNRLYKAKSFKRVFPHAGKYEAKHRKHNLHLWYELKVESPEKLTKIISAYAGLAEVNIAEPIYQKAVVGSQVSMASETAPNMLVNDALFGDQWHYDNTGQSGGTAGADIQLN